MANIAARMVFFPQVVSGRKGATHPRLDLFLSFPDFYDGAQVRLVVYQLDMYRAGLGQNEGANFHKFKQGDLTRAFLDGSKVDPRYGSEQNPKMGVGSGVLLKLEGSLHRSKEKKVKAFWFGLRGSPEENTAKPPFSILRFHLAMSEEDVISGRVSPKAIARVILLDDSFQNMYTDHRLAVRISLTSAHAGIAAGGVIAASLCPEHNPAIPPDPKDNPKNKGVIVFDAAAVKAGKPQIIGGDGGDAPALPPTANPRILPFDLTGIYEHADGARDPALLLHLNQAGHGLVGWFAFPIPMPSPQPPAPIAGLPPAPGCLWVSSMETEDKSRGYQFLWASQANNTTNTMDPDEIAPGTKGAPGWIKRATDPKDPNVDAVTLTFEHDDGSSSPAITLRKIRNEARWPWAIINDPAHLSKEERELVIADQVRPVATAVWERLRKQMDPKTVLEKGPPERTIESVLTDWVNAPRGSARAGHRGKLADHLRNLMGPFIGHLGDYPHRAAAHIKAGAAKYVLTIGTVTDTMLAWFQRVVDDTVSYMVEKREAGEGDFKNKTDQELYDKLEQGFKDAELAPRGKFIYTMKFFKLLNTPKALSFIKGYWFTVTIKKEEEKKDGSRTEDPEWAAKGWDKTHLHGVFVATGVGATMNEHGKGKASSAGGLPGPTEFSSFVGLQFPDFDGAIFSVVGVSGPSATFGPFSTKMASSLVQFTLKNGARLSAVVEVTSAKADPDPKKGRSIGGSFFELSGGGGKLLSDIPKGKAPPRDSSDDIATNKSTNAGVFVLFKRDSAVLEQRSYFERRLAMNRAMFENGEPSGCVIGYTSPEASKAHNQDLSVRRASAVKMAIKDALDPELIPGTLDVIGLGEDPSIKAGGLLDPPGKTKEEKIRVHEEELTQYWLWRAVDVWVQGSLVVRARPKEEQKGKP
ncbi:MAG: hypothetical protein R3B70_20955 [Polyangiaceae bacterium]